MKKILSMILVAMMTAMPIAAMADANAPAPSPEVIAVEEAAATETTVETTEETTEETIEETIEAAAPIGMANPFQTCTDVEAAALLGATYTIAAPEGFELVESARMSDDMIAQGLLPTVRIAYMNEEAMYRVHITKDATPLTATEGVVEVDANGIVAYYNADACSITYAQGEYVITIDAASYTLEQLVAAAGTVTVTPVAATEETEATETAEIEATAEATAAE